MPAPKVEIKISKLLPRGWQVDMLTSNNLITLASGKSLSKKQAIKQAKNYCWDLYIELIEKITKG